MKRLAILLEFYKKNLLAVLVVLALMTCALFYTLELLGYLRYQTYSLRRMEEMGFTDGVYVMAADGFDQWEQGQTPTYDEFLAQNFPGVERSVNPPYSYSNWNGSAVNLVVCDEDFVEHFSFQDQGAWLSQDGASESQLPEVVVGGFLFADVSVGDTIRLEEYNEDGSVRASGEVYVIGKDQEPTLTFGLGYKAASVAADKIFSNCNNVIYLTEGSLVRLKGFDDSSKHNNFLVTFRPDASEAERQEALDFLGRRGSFLTFDEIRAFSQEEITARLRTELPRPLFLLGISAFSMLSISVLLTEKQRKDHLVYYLVGYSRRRAFCDTFVGILGIGLVAGGLDLLYLFWLNRNFIELKNADYVKYHNYLVMNDSVWVVLAFVVLTALLASLLPLAMLRKNSPIDVYRRSL